MSNDWTNEFSNEDVKLMVEQEQKMDSGEQAFVLLNGGRIAMFDEAMTEFGLKHGQTINELIFHKIIEFNISLMTAKMESKKLMDSASNPEMKTI